MERLLIIEDKNQEHMKKNVTTMNKGGEKVELLFVHSWIMII